VLSANPPSLSVSCARVACSEPQVGAAVVSWLFAGCWVEVSGPGGSCEAEGTAGDGCAAATPRPFLDLPLSAAAVVAKREVVRLRGLRGADQWLSICRREISALSREASTRPRLTPLSWLPMKRGGGLVSTSSTERLGPRAGDRAGESCRRIPRSLKLAHDASAPLLPCALSPLNVSGGVGELRLSRSTSPAAAATVRSAVAAATRLSGRKCLSAAGGESVDVDSGGRRVI